MDGIRLYKGGHYAEWQKQTSNRVTGTTILNPEVDHVSVVSKISCSCSREHWSNLVMGVMCHAALSASTVTRKPTQLLCSMLDTKPVTKELPNPSEGFSVQTCRLACTSSHSFRHLSLPHDGFSSFRSNDKRPATSTLCQPHTQPCSQITSRPSCPRSKTTNIKN